MQRCFASLGAFGRGAAIGSNLPVNSPEPAPKEDKDSKGKQGSKEEEKKENKTGDPSHQTPQLSLSNHKGMG